MAGGKKLWRAPSAPLVNRDLHRHFTVEPDPLLLLVGPRVREVRKTDTFIEGSILSLRPASAARSLRRSPKE